MLKQINLRVNEELNAQIEAKCDQLSLKKAQFIRLAILKALNQPQLSQLLETTQPFPLIDSPLNHDDL